MNKGEVVSTSTSTDKTHMVYIQKSRGILSNSELTSMVNMLSMRVGVLEEMLYNSLNIPEANESSKIAD